MLGWEFPPLLSGGLGVACYGLSKALNSQGVDVLFLLPRPRKAAPAPVIRREARTLAPPPIPPTALRAVAAAPAPARANFAPATPPPPPPPSPPPTPNGQWDHRPPTEIRAVPAATQAEVHQRVEQAAAHRAALEAADRAPPSPQPHFGQGASPDKERIFVEEGREITEEVQTTEQVPMRRVTFVPLDVWLQPYMTPVEYQRMVVEEISGQRTVSRWETRWEKTGGRWIERAREAGPDGAVHQPPNTPPPPPPPPEVIQALPAPAPLAPRFAEPASPPPPPSAQPERPYIEEPPAAVPVIGAENTAYAGDLFSETERYARLALAVARGEGGNFDVVHAHDWMTFEAAMAVAADAERPLIVQIHSTELDRAGSNANARIMEIERLGMMTADAVVAVSYKTKTQLIEKYGIDPRKIEVVYNAADTETPAAGRTTPAQEAALEAAQPHQKTVLFLGRLTRQKGPGYFLQAARKVLSVEPDVRFVLAGKGDMEAELKKLAAQLGIRKNVVFAGFLEKEQAQQAFQAADLYVMPSVSEPFGIAPLEALAKDVPVIISKQSGVAEVLRHVLKVDFWDSDDLANKILAVLRHPPLAATLRQHGQTEARQLSWDDSAQRVIELYERLTGKLLKAPVVEEETAAEE
jgi:glycosyltransferase involved in cell wall biosynthesis